MHNKVALNTKGCKEKRISSSACTSQFYQSLQIQLHNIDTVAFFFFHFFFIQFNVPFKIISLIETSQSIGGAKREYPGKIT